MKMPNKSRKMVERDDIAQKTNLVHKARKESKTAFSVGPKAFFMEAGRRRVLD